MNSRWLCDKCWWPSQAKGISWCTTPWHARKRCDFRCPQPRNPKPSSIAGLLTIRTRQTYQDLLLQLIRHTHPTKLTLPASMAIASQHQLMQACTSPRVEPYTQGWLDRSTYAFIFRDTALILTQKAESRVSFIVCWVLPLSRETFKTLLSDVKAHVAGSKANVSCHPHGHAPLVRTHPYDTSASCVKYKAGYLSESYVCWCISENFVCAQK